MNVLFSVKTVSFSLLVAWPTTILFAFLQQIGLHFHLFMENGNTTQLLLFAVLRAWQLFDTLPCFLELGLQFIQLLVHLVQVWWVFFNTANTHTHTHNLLLLRNNNRKLFWQQILSISHLFISSGQSIFLHLSDWESLSFSLSYLHFMGWQKRRKKKKGVLNTWFENDRML